MRLLRRTARPLTPPFASPAHPAGAPNVVWSHPAPLPAVGAVAGLLAFYDEAVDITVDGERLERPVTPFTTTLVARPPA
ncbi:hypothetical protein [Streptomyces sp. NPDC088812]|uniref:hypothetical protein n=1 Tax=Streptomyces sp. NPDC088812 TaxID=3365905 RepID=UPI0037F9AFDE